MCEAQIIEPTYFGMVLVVDSKPVARARKAGGGFGWSIAHLTARPFKSIRNGKPTQYLAVKTKGEARSVLASLAPSCGAAS